jgi:large subunit ribosomal protein L4
LQDARRLLVILPEYDEVTYKCFRNLPNVTVRTAPSKSQEAKSQAFSARDLMVAKKILLVEGALNKIEEVWSK